MTAIQNSTIIRNMNELQFIAALVSALAWPLTVIVIILLLRSHIPSLLTSLRKVKLSGFELELERTRAEVEAALDDAGTSAPPPTADEGVSAAAAADPIGTVIRQFTRVEAELRKQLTKAGVANLDGKSAVQLAALGAREGVFTPAAADTVRGVSVLRNLAAHGNASELTPDKVAEYEALIDATVLVLGHRPEDI